MTGRPRPRWVWPVGVVAAAGVVVAAVVALWPDPEPAPRAREYRDYDVCLLTGERGLADTQAAAVWAGAQRVSEQRKVRVMYLAVTGEQTPQRAAEVLASLVARDCEIIVAVGSAPVAAVAAEKGRYPDATIVAVGNDIDASSDERITQSTVDVLLRLVPEAR